MENIFFIFILSHEDVFVIDLREKHWCKREASIGCFLYAPGPRIVLAQMGNQTHNLGMFPDQELNLQPSGYEMILQPPEPHQPGGNIFLEKYFLLFIEGP